MQAQLLLQNPEFLMAGLLALFMLFLPRKNEERAEKSANIFEEIALTLLMQLPEKYKSFLIKRMQWAGRRGTKELARFAAMKVYPAIASLLLGLILPLPIVAVAFLAAFFAADFELRSAVKKRQAEISASLPQAIDLMLLCVDAGLGLDATLQRIGADRSSLSNGLNDELSLLGRDILLGMKREAAYQELFERTGVEELKSLGSALNQSNKMGLSISKILRAQSDFVRVRLGQKAEEKAARLPIWMTFPLWFCIMPSLMLILLGPSLILFFQNIMGGL
jgi:tight adherence protein C